MILKIFVISLFFNIFSVFAGDNNDGDVVEVIKVSKKIPEDWIDHELTRIREISKQRALFVPKKYPNQQEWPLGVEVYEQKKLGKEQK